MRCLFSSYDIYIGRDISLCLQIYNNLATSQAFEITSHPLRTYTLFIYKYTFRGSRNSSAEDTAARELAPENSDRYVFCSNRNHNVIKIRTRLNSHYIIQLLTVHTAAALALSGCILAQHLRPGKGARSCRSPQGTYPRPSIQRLGNS